MAAGANDLAALADVQAFASVPSGQDPALLQTLITAASAFIQRYIGYNIAVSTYTEIRNGNGRGRLVLLNTPVVAIQSLDIGAAAQTPSAGYGQTGYSLNGNIVYLANAGFCRGLQNISITYTAGYETVPSDLNQACCELVALRYQMRQKISLTSEGGLDQTTTYLQKDMPASVLTAINSYRRVFAA